MLTLRVLSPSPWPATPSCGLSIRAVKSGFSGVEMPLSGGSVCMESRVGRVVMQSTPPLDGRRELKLASPNHQIVKMLAATSCASSLNIVPFLYASSILIWTMLN